MKSLIQYILSVLGYQLIKKGVEGPFEYLHALPRYTETTLELEGSDFTVADTHSFYHSYAEIFEGEIYRFKANDSSPVIVDCGANYGTSIVYFKSLYPDARITGIEADPYIFSLLQSNLSERSYSDVRLVNRALSNSSQPVEFFTEGADAGRVHPRDGSSELKVYTASLDEFLQEPVDFLKMDIEGAETEVLIRSKMLSSVKTLFVEYHSFQDAPQELDLLLKKLSEEGFRYYIQTQFCPPRPFCNLDHYLGMDLQLNIFAMRA
ncbi:MAG: FkbM family methyltransferase [Halioglobus sp.]